MLNNIFLELSIILIITLIISTILKLLKQPIIIGYIITGLILSLLNITAKENISIFANMGIALLLFIVGLNLSPSVIKEVGKVSLITGVIQVLFTTILGFVLSKILGFSFISSLYIAIALTFSSTIIVMKLLSDKRELDTLYGKISTGILIFQDIIAIIALVLISSISKSVNLTTFATKTIFLGIISIVILILISKYLLPKICNFFAKSQEFLFLFSLSWGLGLAALFQYLNFSLEVGALIAGVTLSLSPYHYEISSKMRPLRDFFLILFFILLGSQISLFQINILQVIAFSLFVLISHPLIIILTTTLLNYKKRIGFLTGISLSQISEFSLIIIALGVNLGHLKSEVLSMFTIIALITISVSSYLIMYSNKVYPLIYKFIPFGKEKKEKSSKEKYYDIILFGYNRIGYNFLDAFKKLRKKFLIIDFNPEVISSLIKKNIPCRYGDANDIEFLEELNLEKTKMLISTIPDFETNILLINRSKRENKKIIIIVVAHQIKEANILYEKGATYVLMPHFLGGHHASLMIKKYEFNIKRFLEERKKHIQHLKARMQIGHEHPKVEHK